MNLIETTDSTDLKRTKLQVLETQIAHKFMVLMSVAQDLASIRDQKLWPQHLTFEDYALIKWGMGEDELKAMLEFVAVLGDLSSNESGRRLLPLTPHLVQEFSNLTSDDRIALAKRVGEELGASELSVELIKRCRRELFLDQCSESNP